ISIVLQFALGLWLTRHLRRLTAAGEAMAGGDLSARVAVDSDDEVGQLAAAFNTMAKRVADRMRELRASEAKFHAIADYSYGCELWVGPDWRPIYGSDEAYLGLRLSVHDVTGRQEAENKLSETLRQLERANAIQKEYLVLASDERARLNALLNAMQIGILFVDRNNRVIYSNPAFEQVWLLTRSKTRFIGMDAAALLVQTTEQL